MLQSSENVNWSYLGAARFILAFIVVNCHHNFFVPDAFSQFLADFGGKAAVIGFLVISGFSISASLERARTGFLYRRFLRIYPAYIFAVGLAIVLELILGQYRTERYSFEASSMLQVTGSVLMVQNFLVKSIYFNPVIWSLSIEFFFYIVARYADRFSLILFIAATILSLIIFVMPRTYSKDIVYQIIMKANMVRYFWPFILGVWLYHSRSSALYIGAAIVGSIAIHYSQSTFEPYSALTYLGVLGIMWVSQNLKTKDIRLFHTLGDISYPLYLMHIPVFIALHAFTNIRGAPIYTVVTILASVAVLYLIEQPFRSRLSKLGSWRVQNEERRVQA